MALLFIIWTEYEQISANYLVSINRRQTVEGAPSKGNEQKKYKNTKKTLAQLANVLIRA